MKSEEADMKKSYRIIIVFVALTIIFSFSVVCTSESGPEEEVKETEVEPVGETEIAEEKPVEETEKVGETEEKSIEYMLASINVGRPIDEDDESVEEFRNLLDEIEKKVPNSRENIADISVTVWETLNEDGFEISLLQVMRDLKDASLEETGLSLEEIGAAYIVLAENMEAGAEEDILDIESKYLSSGMYKIGIDIPAGEYLIISDGMGYYEVTKDSSGTLDSIISNDNFSNTRYITVSENQYLEIKRSKMLPASDAEPQMPVNGEYPEGMYKVGKDIPAGEYKIASTGEMGYYELAKNSIGTLDSIVSNDNFEGEKYITIKDGQYLTLTRCKLIFGN
jgi:hypothetical protein